MARNIDETDNINTLAERFSEPGEDRREFRKRIQQFADDHYAYGRKHREQQIMNKLLDMAEIFPTFSETGERHYVPVDKIKEYFQGGEV